MISDEVKNKIASVPWKKMAGIRDHLIHNYAGVNLDIVWSVVTKELAFKSFRDSARLDYLPF